MTDLRLLNEGTISILTPETDRGKDWVNEHLPADSMRWGQLGVVIEHRFVADIVNGALEDELTVGT